MMGLADRLGKSMAKVGIDQFRSGCFDAVERDPRRPADRVRLGQHEGLLAAGAGHPGLPDPQRLQPQSGISPARAGDGVVLELVLPRSRSGGHLLPRHRGRPAHIAGDYSDKGGHAVAGYHSFELNYLAHTYNRAFSYRKDRREDNVFCMHFKPHVNSGQRSINVLPDFFAPGEIEVVGVVVNGSAPEERRPRPVPDPAWTRRNSGPT